MGAGRSLGLVRMIVLMLIGLILGLADAKSFERFQGIVRQSAEIQAILGLEIDLTQFLPHLGLSLLVLLVPTGFVFLVHGLMRSLYWLVSKTRSKKSQNWQKPKPFLELVYGYLPLVLGGSLAHYLRLGLGEAGRILPVTFATFGLSGTGLPVVVAHPAVIAFLQGTTLVFSVLLTVILTQKIARQPFRLLLPQHLGAVIIAISIWAIVVGR